MLISQSKDSEVQANHESCWQASVLHLVSAETRQLHQIKYLAIMNFERWL